MPLPLAAEIAIMMPFSDMASPRNVSRLGLFLDARDSRPTSVALIYAPVQASRLLLLSFFFLISLHVAFWMNPVCFSNIPEDGYLC